MAVPAKLVIGCEPLVTFLELALLLRLFCCTMFGKFLRLFICCCCMAAACTCEYVLAWLFNIPTAPDPLPEMPD